MDRIKKFIVCLLIIVSLSFIVFASTNKIIYETKNDLVPEYIIEDKTICYTKYFNNLTINKNIISDTEEVCFVQKEKKLVKYNVVQKETNNRIGAIYDNKIISNKKGINLIDDKLIEWSVPVGKRNFVEFPTCTTTEKNRGVCSEK